MGDQDHNKQALYRASLADLILRRTQNQINAALSAHLGRQEDELIEFIYGPADAPFKNPEAQRQDKITEKEATAHQEAVAIVNNALVGESNVGSVVSGLHDEIERLDPSYSRTAEPPRTIPQLLKLQHSLLFAEKLAIQSSAAGSASEVAGHADALTLTQQDLYMQALRDIAIKHHPDAVDDDTRKASLQDEITKIKLAMGAAPNKGYWANWQAGQGLFGKHSIRELYAPGITIPQLIQIKCFLAFQKELQEEKARKANMLVHEAQALEKRLRQKHHAHYLSELKKYRIISSSTKAQVENIDALKRRFAAILEWQKQESDPDAKRGNINDEQYQNNLINKEIIDSRERAEQLRNEQNWIERGIHQSKGFALSCGTTMAGAAIMLADALFPTWFFMVTVFASPFFVTWVTQANWWLTNKGVAELFKDLFCNKQENAKYVKSSLKGLKASFFFSFMTSVVWSFLTYATTDTLIDEASRKFGESLGIMGYATEVAIFIAAILIIKGIFDLARAILGRTDYTFSRADNRNGSVIKFVRGMMLAASGLFLAVMSNLALSILPIVIAALMAAYTFPTIWGVFHAYGKMKAEKALSSNNDLGMLKKQFVKIAATNDLNTINNNYNLLLGVVAIPLAIFTAVVMVPYLQNQGGMMGLAVGNPMPLFILMLGFVALVTFSYLVVSQFRNRHKDDNIASAADKIYTGYKLLAATVIFGSLSTLLASVPIMTAAFELTGLGSIAAIAFAYIVAVGFGLPGAAIFYEGATRNAMKNIFHTEGRFKQANSVSEDVVGIHNLPDYQTATQIIQTQKMTWWERIADNCSWLYNKFYFFTVDKRAAYGKTVGVNALLNGMPSGDGQFGLFESLFMADGVSAAGAAGLGFSAGAVASGMGNLGEGKVTTPPSEQHNIDMAQDAHSQLVALNLGALAVGYENYAAARNTGNGSNCTNYLTVSGAIFGHSKTVKMDAATKMSTVLHRLADDTKSVQRLEVGDGAATHPNIVRFTKLEWHALHSGKLAKATHDACSNAGVNHLVKSAIYAAC